MLRMEDDSDDGEGEEKRMTSRHQRSGFVLPAAASGCLEGKHAGTGKGPTRRVGGKESAPPPTPTKAEH